MKSASKKKTLRDYAVKSTQIKTPKSLPCNISLQVDGEKWNAYEVSISHCDLLFYCDKGTANYIVDTIHGQVLGIELFNWERD